MRSGRSPPVQGKKPLGPFPVESPWRSCKADALESELSASSWSQQWVAERCTRRRLRAVAPAAANSSTTSPTREGSSIGSRGGSGASTTSSGSDRTDHAAAGAPRASSAGPRRRPRGRTAPSRRPITRTTQRTCRATADPHRHVRLHGGSTTSRRRRVRPLIGRLPVRQRSAQRPHGVVGPIAPTVEVGAQQVELLGQRPDTDARMSRPRSAGQVCRSSWRSAVGGDSRARARGWPAGVGSCGRRGTTAWPADPSSDSPAARPRNPARRRARCR